MAKKKDGNFAVMHMDFFNKPQMDERDLAAKRSSEATQAAALNAIKNGYPSLKRSKRIWNHQDSEPPAGPPVPHQHAPPHPQYPYMPPTPGYWQTRPDGGPPPPEVKAEQARLLTFLRSLHPVLVVDQLCKALAYFGGIPGAPPPPDNRGFPQSDRNNGSGSLVVGWLSEIFPPADLPPSSRYPGPGGLGGTDAGQAGNAGSSGAMPGRRPRGRPKGSKSTKTRKDKGVKKGPRVPTEGEGAEPDGTPTQAELVDERNNQVPQPSDQPSELAQVPEAQSSADGPSTLDESQHPDSSILSTPGSKRKGRPKGSKNRPKGAPVDLTQSQAGSANPAPQASPTLNVARAASNGTTTNPPHDSTYSSSQSAQRSIPAARGALSLHAQNWTDPPPQSPRRPGDNTRKRSIEQTAAAHDSAAQGNQTSEQVQQQSQARHQLPEGAQGNEGVQGVQGARGKRRRISDSLQSTATQNPGPKQSGTDSAAAPGVNNAGVPHNVTSNSSSGSFGPQSPRTVAPTSRPNSGQMGRQPGPQFRPSPQQQFQQPQRNTSTAHSMNQGQRQQQQQQQQQNYYVPQRQPQQQFSSNQHQSHIAAPAAPSSSASAPYPSFGDSQQYLSMQYALSAGRSVQQQQQQQQRNAPSSFGTQAQLDATMGDPRIQEHLFDPYSRR